MFLCSLVVKLKWVFLHFFSMVEAVDLADESDSDGGDVVLPELDEVDEKSFLQVQRMVTGLLAF